MLAMTGRVTMLGISRWTDQGGSYRTIQRFFNTVIAWSQVQWFFIRYHLLEAEDSRLVAILALEAIQDSLNEQV
jgi:putative transposase